MIQKIKKWLEEMRDQYLERERLRVRRRKLQNWRQIQWNWNEKDRVVNQLINLDLEDCNNLKRVEEFVDNALKIHDRNYLWSSCHRNYLYDDEKQFFYNLRNFLQKQYKTRVRDDKLQFDNYFFERCREQLKDNLDCRYRDCVLCKMLNKILDSDLENKMRNRTLTREEFKRLSHEYRYDCRSLERNRLYQ